MDKILPVAVLKYISGSCFALRRFFANPRELLKLGYTMNTRIDDIVYKGNDNQDYKDNGDDKQRRHQKIRQPARAEHLTD